MKALEIKALRKAMGLTQVRFAKMLSVSFATLNRWENSHNRPLPDRAKKLAHMAQSLPKTKFKIQPDFRVSSAILRLEARFNMSWHIFKANDVLQVAVEAKSAGAARKKLRQSNCGMWRDAADYYISSCAPDGAIRGNGFVFFVPDSVGC